ncbi:C-type mannose receptor 2-like [Micropterus salmoides]|uniref:C-type mannose receptor 2-like n=1 Tax=Micropterus salmoides TaxID=27706 RepID=UPI0018ECE040|nr:C-type mannose receptor 2-like [Micropterus salmoides]
MNWTEAQTYCRKTYTDRATIENTEEVNQLINTVSSSGLSSDVWIGLYTKINWRWSDGYTGTGAGFRSWHNYENEPNFKAASEFCVTIGKDGVWWDDRCSRQFPFICYRGTQLDPEFVAVIEPMSWSSAQSYCRKNFTDLANVRNNTENLKIGSLVPYGHVAWFGLFRDPDMYWSDGSGFSFSYWNTDINPLGSMSVVCGAALQSSGSWKFLPCETRLPFVCYSVPVRRQAVKLRLKLEDSSVDLNDPAVKADMLKKLQDRLKEKGVSGVTLKWREQPDGKVFHKEDKPEL